MYLASPESGSTWGIGKQVNNIFNIRTIGVHDYLQLTAEIVYKCSYSFFTEADYRHQNFTSTILCALFLCIYRCFVVW
jgi:hypothetical protein